MPNEHLRHSKMPDLFKPGDKIGVQSQYVVDKKLNSGAYGQVFRAHIVQADGGKLSVAIKVRNFLM